MNVKVQDIEKNVVQLEIEIDVSKFDEGMEKSYRKNMKRFSIPGFRKGKVPRKVVERYYGEAVLYDDAVNFICPEAYEQAIKENDIHAVSQPEIDIVQIGNGENFIFTAKVTVKPQVELGEYLGIEAKMQEVNVTDEDVEKELNTMAERNSRLVNVENREVQDDDTAVIDFEGFVDGEPFEGGKASDYYLNIGSGQFIPGFEEQLKGAKIDEELDVNVTFPEDYVESELAGKPAVFKVKIKGIKKKELPIIDDEFAKDVSEFDTLEEYKEDLKNKIIEREENRVKNEIENEVIKTVVENAKVDIPQVMIDNRLDGIVQDFDLRLRYQGVDLESYLKMTNTDITTFREKYTEIAANDVKTQLVIEKIKDKENIDVTEDEFEEELKKYADNSNKSYEEYKKLLSEDDIEYIKNNFKARKTIEFLVKNAKLV
ncbi:MAG TPA: trigger factor [Clostridiaceae bacterium]|jgi:trigger factor|nr:trigger factor [Clostridiaceae bacterium]